MAKKKKKKTPQWLKKLEFALMMLVVRRVEKLSVERAYAWAERVGSLLFFVDRKHRKRAIEHILHSGIRTAQSEAIKLARKSFQHLVKVFVEVVKAPQIITAENFRDYYEIDDRGAEWMEFFAPPHSRPVILASAHIGNWELAGSAYVLISGIPMCSIMRPLGNELLGNFFYARRAVHGHTTISKRKGLRPLLKTLLAGHSIAIVADQHAAHAEGVEIEFFGHPARAHMTPALLALKTKVPIICSVLIRKDDRFHFKLTGSGPVHYTPTGDKQRDIRAITQLYSDLIADTLRKYPEQWLWSHRRWLDCNRKSTSGENKKHENPAL